ncbi:MAG TPA: hypothetical protein VGZ52_11485, partial [Acidimicrobiales bacterium]|nr:hypothetical protein [Acidimicrobiales bacterium]
MSKAKAPKTVVIDEPSALTTDLTSVLPIDREELAVLVDALGLPRPSRVSPLPDILRSAERTASRSWSEIRAPLETMSDATFADHLTPLIAPDRVVDIRATAYEAAPVPVRLYSSRRHEPGWAGLRSGAERDFEVLAPYIDGDISYFVLLNLKLSMGSSDELPWAALNGAELAFFCAVVDAWRMQFHLTSARRRSRPQPVTFRFDDILEAQRDGWETRDRRWLLTALGETLGVLAHPGGRSGVTFPVLTLDELRQHTRDWVERGWLEVIATGENPTLQLGPPITGAV